MAKKMQKKLLFLGGIAVLIVVAIIALGTLDLRPKSELLITPANSIIFK